MDVLITVVASTDDIHQKVRMGWCVSHDTDGIPAILLGNTAIKWALNIDSVGACSGDVFKAYEKGG
jgi:hypothetical protein